jgi:cytochrome c peroxidase
MRDGGVPLDAPARRGFGVFMGKGRCGSCHFAPLFGGTVPPGFDETEAEVIGVPSRAMSHAATVDGDCGSGAVDRSPLHDRAFKTPSLRNVAATAPYMHNGVYRTLDEVVDFYDRGGGVGIGARVPNQTLSVRPLHLTRTEQTDLIAFLRSLTDAVVDRGIDDGAR